ncbi:MAG: inositol monophosphatase [Bacteriovoracaceae bacterium]|nr:inositol monophosphatase [Bacteriovoracaceae bacterium]
MKLTKKFLNEAQDFALDVSYEAGEILLKYQKRRNSLEVMDKGPEGIASEADVKSEEYILDRIKERFPKHYILSEEDYNQNPQASYEEAAQQEFAWLIDPLDGTNNFVNGIPLYAVSIALLHKGEPVAGVVYNPTSGECFFAARGLGAHLIDFRINPFKKYHLMADKNTKEMHECIFSPAPIYETSSRFEKHLSVFRNNIIGARAVRRLGTAALELCYVANGNFDGYWEKNLKPWDVAAAGIVCKEAHVKMTDFDGKDYTPFDMSILAAREPLHGKIFGAIKR